MKKLIALLVTLVLFLSIFCSSIAEEFTLHSGVRFGMTQEEVIAKETEKGFSPYATTMKYTYYDENGGYYKGDTNALSIAGSMAGIANSHLYYYFDENNKLFAAVYEFGGELMIEAYNDIQATIEKKYNEQKTQEEYKVTHVVDTFYGGMWTGKVYAFKDIQIKLDNGSIITITHALFYPDTSTGAEGNLKFGYGRHYLEYHLSTREEIDNIYNWVIKPQLNEMLEQEQQKNDDI